MKRKEISIIFIVLLLFGSLNAQNSSQKSIDIDGYLVDANDKPLRNGRVTVFYDPPLPTTSWEQLILSWAPLGDGLFGVKADWYRGRKLMVLMEDRPEGFYPIASDVLTNKRIFKGVVISKYASEKNLGRFREYIRYGRAAFDVTQCSASFLEKIERQRMYVKVTTFDGFEAANTTFRSAYNRDSGRLVFNLPEGSWHMEFVDETAKTAVLQTIKVIISPYKTNYIKSLGCSE